MKSGLGPKPPSPMWTKSIQFYFIFYFYFPYSLGRVKYSIVKLFIFYFYPRPLREHKSTDGHFLLLLQLFPTSNFLFLPGWKNTSFIPTHDLWPTRHDLTSSPSYVITSVCDSFSDRISNLICIVVNNHCVSFYHDPLGVLSHAFSSETQHHLYCLCKLPSQPARCAFSCFLKWDAAPPILSV